MEFLHICPISPVWQCTEDSTYIPSLFIVLLPLQECSLNVPLYAINNSTGLMLNKKKKLIRVTPESNVESQVLKPASTIQCISDTLYD